MLKKIFALCLTAGCIFCVGLLPSIILKTAPRARVVTPQQVSYQPTVQCTGTVRSEWVYDLVAGGTYQITQVRCQAGERVEAGQTLAIMESVDGKAFFIRQASRESGGQEGTLAHLAQEYGINSTQFAAMADLGEISAAQITIPDEEKKEAVTAPVTGIVTTDLPPAGTSVTPGMVLCQVQSSSLLVTARIREEDVQQVAVGNQVFITGEGLEGETAKGTVERIRPIAQQVLDGLVYETVVEADIRLTEIPKAMKPGYGVRLSILTGPEKQIWTLPYEAVDQDSDNQEFVYITQDGSLEKRLITTGIEMVEGVEIVEGLEQGEAVAVLANTQDLPKKSKVYLVREE